MNTNSDTISLSIVTICKNHLAGLQKTVTSILDQDCSDYDLIVVDGASDDGTTDYLQFLSHQGVRWISEPDRGIYHAMNKGISLAQGEYILFLNAGDTFSTNQILSKTIPMIGASDIHYGDINLVKNNKCIGSKHYPSSKNLSALFFLNDTICQQSIYFRKSLFNDGNLFSEKYLCSDWLFLLQGILINSFSYTHIDLVICNYDIDGISFTAQSKVKQERKEILEFQFPLLAPAHNQILFLENVWASKGIPSIYAIHLLYRKLKHSFLKKVKAVLKK